MKEPRRIREESKSPIERMLLETAASYRRPPSTKVKTLAALGLAGSAALSAGAAQTAWAAVVAKVGGAKGLVAIAALGAAIAVPAVYYGARLRTETASAPSVAPASAPRVVGDFSHASAAANPIAAPALAPEPIAPFQEATPTVPAPFAPRERRSRAGSNHTRPARRDVAPVAASSAPAPATADELTAEVGAVEAARARLAKGDAAAALALLDDYASAFPRGRLQPEAMVLRIDALAKSGRAGEARRAAEMFVQRYPNSVLAARVRGHLAD